MYLKILAQSKIIEKAPLNEYKILDNTRLLSAKYLNEYESIPNNEDKYRDVYNVTEGLKKYPISETAFAAKISSLDSLQKNAQKFMYGKGTIDYKLAYNAYKELAELGDANGDNGLGNLYLHGWAVEKNLEKAKSLFELSASKGNINGQVSIGMFLKVQEQNKITAEFQKQTIANNFIGNDKLDYQYFLDLKENENRVKEYFKLAVIQSTTVKYALDPKTHFFLGDVYKNGEYGYNKDTYKAKEYFLLSIDNDDAEIQYEVGRRFYYEMGMPIDNLQAAKCFKLAYQNGKDKLTYDERLGKDIDIQEESSMILSYIYKQGGFGVEKDKKESKFWYTKSEEVFNLMQNNK